VIQERIEGPGKEIQFTKEGKRAILSKLVEAEGFENFFDIKYPGGKRFGLDGAEAMIPALEQIIKRGGQLGSRRSRSAWPPRAASMCSARSWASRTAPSSRVQGRLDLARRVEGSGDVKYHLGASSDRRVDNNRVHLR